MTLVNRLHERFVKKRDKEENYSVTFGFLTKKEKNSIILLQSAKKCVILLPYVSGMEQVDKTCSSSLRIAERAEHTSPSAQHFCIFCRVAACKVLQTCHVTAKSAKNLSAERCFAVSAEQKGGMARERGAVICGYDKALSHGQGAFLPAQTLRVRLSSVIIYQAGGALWPQQKTLPKP